MGANRAGKTNLLESIYFLSFGSSFKSRSPQNLIKIPHQFCSVVGLATINERKLSLKINLYKEDSIIKKQFIINRKLRKLSEFLGKVKVVSFLPTDINLVESSPAEKRKYFDNLIFQIVPYYYSTVTYLEKVILRRNKVLERLKQKRAQEEELLFWNKELLNYGWEIFLQRKRVINFLNHLLNKIFSQLNQNQSHLTIKYLSFLPSYFQKDKKIVTDWWQKKLTQLKNQEIEKTCTLVGPHRDDFRFFLNNQDLSTLGSRSELRQTILALKFAEGKLIEKVTQEKPIFLLDDIDSELDKQNRKCLFEFLEKHQDDFGQIFLTTTSLEKINQDFLKQAKIFKIEKGYVC